ncbi:murein L,D-transpeptidase [Sphingomonas koreensis]|uniref:Murein L,D-transpeptidase n=2 Tax=Pseudomonadota TaxID=1224 RepID=A0AAJ4S3S8_9SPHN|nr:murein L,D-transpeptidase [Sphingomonas koreensis]RSU23426.1 murein L,D-transpeptidase [Sphingomonas koreensis]RSU25349.1 murein L,D-transpeptidase [Sphingomonas koreensis]RSU38265.1 murein L,D-transpeptidase [Sphingomonas koreensis]RSU38949.1 murein L,D-transpeptidase [Sphingomonas koreensis]
MWRACVNRVLAGWAGLAILGSGIALAQNQVPSAAPAKPPASAEAPGLNRDILHVQVILDQLGFSPGILDGREGQSLTAALTGFQIARQLPVTGKMDQRTLQALHPHRAIRPTRILRLTADSLAGPFVRPWPRDPQAQAKLQAMGYRSAIEKLAEMFHTTPQVLIELNSPDTRLAPGVPVQVPNAVPASRDYPADFKPEWRKTLNDLNVSAIQPKAGRIVVDKSDKVLRVFDRQGKLAAQFSVTTGSTRDPLPIGSWKVLGIATNPDFHYNPKLFWDVSDKKPKVLLPPGPNSPVGVVWIDLSKPHYGIHGTPEPHLIGRTQSHGCVRLTNWDAARLALMVEPGTAVIFQE